MILMDAYTYNRLKQAELIQDDKSTPWGSIACMPIGVQSIKHIPEILHNMTTGEEGKKLMPKGRDYTSYIINSEEFVK